MSFRPEHERKPALAVILGILAYIVVIGTLCQLKFLRFGYTDFDLAAHAQSLHSILAGTIRCTVLGVPFLGNHFVLILYPIALLAGLFPAAPVLLWTQTIVLAVGAWPLYRMAVRPLTPGWAALLAGVYLLYPPLLYMNLYEFHPVALASTALLFALYHLHTDRFAPFMVCSLLAIACQENITLIVAGMGIYAWSLGKRGRWIWTPLASGAVGFVLIVGVILPRLNPGIIAFNAIYGHFGETLPAAALNMLRHPLRAATFALQPAKRSFLVVLLIPLSFTPLLGPRAWIPVLPILAQRLLSNRPSESSIVYHYQAEFIPFIFLGAITGIRRLRDRWPERGRIIALILLITASGSIALSGVVPALAHAAQVDLPRRAIQERAAVIKRIPRDAVVVAPFRYLPHLAHIHNLHSLHHIFFGRYTLSTVPYPIPAADVVILDAFDPLTFSPGGFYLPTGYRRLQELLAPAAWAVAFNEEGFILLERSDPPSDLDQLLRVTAEAPQETPGAPGNESIRLLNSTLSAMDAGTGRYRLTTQWLTTGPAVKDFLADVTLTDTQGRIYRRRIAPGHRVWPPQSWPQDHIITDQQVIHLDPPPTAPCTIEIIRIPWSKGVME